MRWVRTWLVTTRRTDHIHKREQIARTAAELRDLIDEARRDPAVRRWRHEPRRELAGDKPTQCDCGRPYRTAGTLPTPHDWLACPCGGHFWWRCRECGRERVEPPSAYDCRPHRPRSL